MPATERAPVACTLGPADMDARLARIRQLTARQLRSHRLDAHSLYLSYDGAAASELALLVELERECCAFLDFDLVLQGEVVELTIVGPDHAGSDARWLFSQFLPEGPAGAGVPGCACGKG